MTITKDNIIVADTPIDHSEVLPTAPDKPLVESYFEALRTRVATKGDRPFLINGMDATQKIMLSELEPMARKYAKVYTSLGLKRNDKMQISIPNSLEYFPLALGAWVCGAIPSVTDPDLAESTVITQIQDAQALIVICAPTNAEKFHKAIAKVEGVDPNLIVLDDPLEPCNYPKEAGIPMLSDLIKSDKLPDPKPITDFSTDQVSYISWSSGTTGVPKGIQMSFNFIKHRFVYGKSTIPGWDLLTTCMFHISGFGEMVIGGMRHEVVFFRDSDLVKDIKLILKACDQFEITKMVMGTHHVAQLAEIKDVPTDLNLSRVRVIIPVGTTFHPHMGDDVKRVFPNVVFVNCYSMTEVAFLVSMSLSLTCLGPVTEGHQVKIVDPNTQKALKPHEVGEILIKPPYPFPGYLNKPEETAKFCDEDGFCHSGDFGHYDEDGILYFDGRMKDIIKYKNNHIHPFELETIIQQLPGVEEVGVYGEPDPASQELATGVVRLTPGCKMSEKEILDVVAAKVDDFKQLRGGIRFVEKELPRNAMGKLLRRNLNTCK